MLEYLWLMLYHLILNILFWKSIIRPEIFCMQFILYVNNEESILATKISKWIERLDFHCKNNSLLKLTQKKALSKILNKVELMINNSIFYHFHLFQKKIVFFFLIFSSQKLFNFLREKVEFLLCKKHSKHNEVWYKITNFEKK